MRCFHVWLLVHLPCFPCVCPLFRCLLLFAILAAPFIFPFQFVPLLQCVFHAFLVCVFCPVVSTFPCPPRASSFFTAFALLFFIFPLCTAPDTCPIFSLRAFRPGTSSSLSSFLPFFLRPWAFRSPCAFSVFSLCVFSASLPPPSRCYSPFSPPPFPPLPPSFPRFPSPFLRSFPLLRFPFRKKFSLKSCMISSVKYMFYSIFLVCLGKFF